MSLTQMDFDDAEEKLLRKLGAEWDTNKPKTIRRIIKERIQGQSVDGGSMSRKNKEGERA